MKNIVLVFCLIGLSSCAGAKVWTIKESKTGGVIGYTKGHSSEEELHDKLRAIMVCPATFDWVSDELGSSQYTYTTMQPVTSNTTGSARSGLRRASYNERTTSSVPVVQTGTSYWREFTYSCP